MAAGEIDPGPLSECADDTINEVRGDASYYWHNVIGGTVSAFSLTGSRNPIIYADNRTFKPNSSGFLFQVDGTPFGSGKFPLGNRLNLQVGVRYTVYTKFDGASPNFDGTDRDASDNNTLRVFTWLAF